MRNLRRKEWECTLPDGRTIEGVLPDTSMQIQAIELVPATIDSMGAVQTRSLQNLLRLGIRKIDGEQINFQQLQGRRFDQRFNPKENQLLVSMYRRITSPTEAEQEHFDQSVEMKPRGGEYVWSAELQDNETLRELDEVERDLDLLESDIEQARGDAGPADDVAAELDELKERAQNLRDTALQVRGILPGTEQTSNAVEQVDDKHQGNEYLVQAIAGANLLRNCVKEYTHDGEKVPLSPEKLKGDQLDRHFTPKEQQTILTGLMDMSKPSSTEEKDFLGTVKIH